MVSNIMFENSGNVHFSTKCGTLGPVLYVELLSKIQEVPTVVKFQEALTYVKAQEVLTVVKPNQS